jgi:hypothetical protein
MSTPRGERGEGLESAECVRKVIRRSGSPLGGNPMVSAGFLLGDLLHP